MAVHAETLELQLLARGSDAARQRFHHLRRLLFVADVLTGVVSGALVGVVARGSGVQMLLLAAVARGRVAASPRSCADSTPGGPARVGERRQRGAEARAHLPCRVVADCTRCSSRWASARPAAGAFFGALACGAVAGVARSGARMAAHRAPKLRQRTLIVGSGLVADRLAERINDHPELGLDAHRLHRRRRRRPRHRRAPLPRRPQRAQRPGRARARRPRDDRLHPRPPRGAAARAARLPRRRRGRRRRPAAVRVPRRRPLDRADRRHAAALDRRADLLRALARQQADARHRRRRASLLLALAPLLVADRDRDQARLARPGAVHAAALRAAAASFFKLYKFRSMHAEATVEVRDDGAIVEDARRRPHHPRRPGHPPLLARRGAAAAQRAQGRHEPRRPAPARDGRGARR